VVALFLISKLIVIKFSPIPEIYVNPEEFKITPHAILFKCLLLKSN